MKPPIADKIEHKSKIHDIELLDHYHWMRLSDEQKNNKNKDKQTQKVLDYIEKENNYTKHNLKSVNKLQKNIYKEIVSRIKKDDSNVPYKYNGVWYITKYKDGYEYPFYYRKIGSINSQEELLIDVNKLAKGHNFFNLSFNGTMVSPNNKWLCYTVDKEGRNNFDIHFLNIDTKKEIKYTINNTSGNIQWANDSETIFYIKNDTITLLADKVYRHNINDRNNDSLVYELTDKSYYIGLGKTKSLKYIIIAGSSTLANDYLILDADKPNGSFKRFTSKLKKHKYSFDHINNKFFIKTNWKSKNNSIMIAEENSTNRKNWNNFISPNKKIFINDFEVFNDYLVLKERINDLSKIKILNLKDKKDYYYINFDEPAYFTDFAYNIDAKSNKIRYSYGSFITPITIFSYDMKTKKRKILKEQEIVGEYNKKQYITERIYAHSRDGKKIPISLVYNNNVYKKNGKLLLDGYGSYGYTNEPYFSSANLSLLDRGFCYAIAHIRGGKIYGEQWYEDGKMLKKKNTFNDFIDCAKHLINKKYTIKEHLYAEGASAGGLLMGAVANDQSSNIFNGILAGVPFVDVINTMLDDTIPLTTGEYNEWGNPNIKKYFNYMLSYSPYDNISKKDYPNLLITSGYTDSQVQYWEPLKWIAKLRDFKTDTNLLLLDMNMDAGHSGTTGRFKYFEKVALKFSFLFKLENIKK